MTAECDPPPTYVLPQNQPDSPLGCGKRLVVRLKQLGTYLRQCPGGNPLEGFQFDSLAEQTALPDSLSEILQVRLANYRRPTISRLNFLRPNQGKERRELQT
ncbi:hypothetical protein GJAV_G00126140 [Gymnothorax javanicus]|nr:hypothetical protein GJAV_G00126140 [Gymnothorax javanicus]